MSGGSQRAVSAAPDSNGGLHFDLRPFAENRAAWRRFAESHPDAVLYHRDEWIELLRRAYGFDIQLATLAEKGEIRAACPLARSKRPFSRRLIALPFSDFCPPLAADPAAGAHLLAHLAEHPQAAGGVEVRGSAAVSPWQLSTCFENWTLDLRRPLSAVERELGGVLRRKLNRNLRHAMVSGISIARGSAATDAQHFCELQFDARRRLGLPSQPASFFRLAHSIFAPSGAFEVWLARMSGRVVGGLVLLRAGGQLYEKWSARAADAPFGAAHLLLWSVIEEFAGKAEMLDLGRADVRNQGLGQFKKAIGAVAAPLPYSFFPRSPRTVSSEAPGAMQRVLSTLWRRIPSPASRLLGSAIYGYLA